MSFFKRKPAYLFCGILVFFLLGSAYGYEPLLPEKLVIDNVFRPGYGSPVGNVLLVQGEAVIVHQGQMVGYLARQDLPLYKGDTIVTRPQSRMRFKLQDESILTLASETKLTITQSVYEPEKKTRSSFFNMALGRVKFWVKQLADYKHSRVKVKSRTAIIGVRGTQWVQHVGVRPDTLVEYTEAFGIKGTIEAVSTAAPDLKPVIFKAMQKLFIEFGKPVSPVETITPAEFESIQKPFIMQAGKGPDVKIELRKKKGQKKEAAKEAKAVLVSEENIVDPEAIGEVEGITGALTPEVIEKLWVSEQIEKFAEQQLTISEQILEESLIPPVVQEEPVVPPDFPQPPE